MTASGLNFLFGGNTPSSFVAPSADTSEMPAWYADAMQGLTTQAAAIAAQPYNPFPGPQVASLNSLQNQGMASASGIGTAPDALYGQSAANLSAASNPTLDQNTFNSYLNPYTSGLNNTIAQLGQQNLTQNLLPAVNDTFIGAGQFGGSRNADFNARAVQATNQDVLNAQTQNLQSSYNNAMTSYQGALGRQTTAGADLGSLGATQNQGDISDLATQLQAGAVGQNQDQANINASINNFNAQTNYPLTQLNDVNSILRGYNPGTAGTGVSTAQTTQNPSNAVGALGGLGLLTMT